MTNFLAALAATALLATPALAGERRATVSHADLDLKSDAGRIELNRRLAAATEEVCGSYAGVSSAEEREIARCRNQVRHQIGAQLARRWGGDAVARR